MSILRQRHKNMFIALIIGFFLSWSIMIVMYYTLIRGNERIARWFLEDGQLKVTTYEEEEVAEKKMTTSVYTVSDNLDNKQVLTEDNLVSMEIESDYVPQEAVLVKDDLLGHYMRISISPKTILTSQMILSSEEKENNREWVELSGIEIPAFVKIGDQINLRIHFPTGQDYKVVESVPLDWVNEERTALSIALTEDQLLYLSSAKVDQESYIGTTIYISENDVDGLDYTEQYYPLNPNVIALTENYESSQEAYTIREKLDETLKTFFDTKTPLFDYEPILTMKVYSNDYKEDAISEDSMDIDVPNEDVGTEEDIQSERNIDDHSLDTDKEEDLGQDKDSQSIENHLESDSETEKQDEEELHF